MLDLAIILLIPFIGTTLGAGFVFFMRNSLNDTLQKFFLGFAAGVMVAASIWSLIMPALELSESYGAWRIMPSVVGFSLGVGFLLLIDLLTPHIHLLSKVKEGPRSRLSRTAMLNLAVTIHNLPEGMAVGVLIAGVLQGAPGITVAAAAVTSMGIAIQNVPEGAIISMPMRAEGNSRWKSFVMGTLSGAIEPVGGLLVVLLSAILVPTMPYMLSFAAGAMMFVVFEELAPEASQGKHTNWSVIGFSVGFLLMMSLDVMLG